MAASGRSARASVVRTAALFAPFFAFALVGFIYLALGTGESGTTGRIVGLVLVGSVTLLLGYQVVQSVRDMFAGLQETVGPVERRWSRNEFFLFHNTYVFVGKDVYRLSPEQALEVELGDMVRITHLPHTSTVEAIERLPRSPGAAASDG
jgi:hypothetical protein